MSNKWPRLDYFSWREPCKTLQPSFHQPMYCLMCGADSDTFEGGDPDIAYAVIRNCQNIASHYWSADIEPIHQGRMSGSNRVLGVPLPFQCMWKLLNTRRASPDALRNSAHQIFLTKIFAGPA
ncbi:hypothetical protein IE4803_CH02880 [Rhizobium etli bv. phaseoli str. IE4803]|nr:hypothetical protein IE4803_CH02880 [Rhizobium etli bv. phaseoli str. IE4803]